MVSGAGVVGLSGDAWAAWDEESVYGTKVAASGSSQFGYFQSESLRGQVNIREVPNISQAHLDVAQTYVGSEIVEGDLTLAQVYEGFEQLLLHSFGELNGAGGGTSGTFIGDFDLSDRGRYKNTNSPSLSLHVSRGIVGSGATNPTIFTYEGAVIDGFTLACSRDGPLLLTVSIFGETETITTAAVTPSFPTAPVVNGTECTMSWGGVTVPFTSFTLNVRRNIDRDRFFLGTTQTAEPPMGQYSVECSAETEWDNEVRAGSATLRADFRAKTAQILRMRFVSSANIPSTSQNYEFDLTLPKALITAFPPAVGGQGRVLVPMQFKGYNDAASDPPYELRCHQIRENTFAE